VGVGTLEASRLHRLGYDEHTPVHQIIEAVCLSMGLVRSCRPIARIPSRGAGGPPGSDLASRRRGRQQGSTPKEPVEALRPPKPEDLVHGI